MANRVDPSPNLPFDLPTLVLELLRLFNQYGQAINDMHLDGSVTWDPPNLPPNQGAVSPNITVDDARFGDHFIASAPYDLQGMIALAYVQAASTVVIILYNATAGAINLGSGEWRVKGMRPHIEALN